MKEGGTLGANPARKPASAKAGWTSRSVTAMLFVAAFVAVQIAVPLYGLTQERPARFSWQMYSTVAAPPEAFIELRGGKMTAVDVEQLIVNARAEAHYGRMLARIGCQHPDALAVVVRESGEESRTPCR